MQGRCKAGPRQVPGRCNAKIQKVGRAKQPVSRCEAHTGESQPQACKAAEKWHGASGTGVALTTTLPQHEERLRVFGRKQKDNLDAHPASTNDQQPRTAKTETSNSSPRARRVQQGAEHVARRRPSNVLRGAAVGRRAAAPLVGQQEVGHAIGGQRCGGVCVLGGGESGCLGIQATRRSSCGPAEGWQRSQRQALVVGARDTSRRCG
eukprot:262844-Chlamydomonas_euryale.AAC.1